MSLKQSSKEPGTSREASPSRTPPCWMRERDRDCLRIKTAEGEEHLLPYQHFLGAHFRRQEQTEILTINFSSHSITLEGRHLGGNRRTLSRSMPSIGSHPRRRVMRSCGMRTRRLF